MSKADCELRPNRSHLTTLIWQEGLSERHTMGRMPQTATDNQIDYLKFLMAKLEDAGVPYPKPNLESLTSPFERITISPNRRLVAKKKIQYLQNLCRKNKVDISEWVSRKPPKKVYKPYSATPVAMRKLSARKGET